MKFRLALALGCPWPDRLLASLTPREFDEWTEFFQLEPFGGYGDSLRAMKLASVTSSPYAEWEPDLFIGDPEERETYGESNPHLDPAKCEQQLQLLVFRQARIERDRLRREQAERDGDSNGTADGAAARHSTGH